MNLENDRYRFNRMHSLANKIKGVSSNPNIRSGSNSSRGGSSRGSRDSGTRRSKNSEGIQIIDDFESDDDQENVSI